MLGIHYLQSDHVAERELRHPLLRLAQHGLREIDSDDAIFGGVVGKRDSGSNADFENPSADSLRCRDRRLTPAIEHCTEYQIVDRSPACIRLLYGNRVEICSHSCSNYALRVIA